jgi:hypothetical protein
MCKRIYVKHLKDEKYLWCALHKNSLKVGYYSVLPSANPFYHFYIVFKIMCEIMGKSKQKNTLKVGGLIMDRQLMRVKLEDFNLDETYLELFEEYELKTFGDLIQMDVDDISKKDAISFVEAILKMDEEFDEEDKDMLKSIKLGEEDPFQFLESLLDAMSKADHSEDEDEEEAPKKKKRKRPIDDGETPKKKKRPVD